MVNEIQGTVWEGGNNGNLLHVTFSRLSNSLTHSLAQLSCQCRDAEIRESNAELAALQREAAELATELRVSEH